MRTDPPRHEVTVPDDVIAGQQSKGGRILRRIGIGLTGILILPVLFLTVLPIVLLYVVTAVPGWISTLLLLLDGVILYILVRDRRSPLRLAGVMAGFVLVAALAVLLSQHFATTPPIRDMAGEIIPGSIATLETVDLNGSTQWITIRGHSEELPVLLFLAGGPGGSELVMTRRYLAELEAHFIVVNWDQPGTGKSYNAVPVNSLTPERFIQDGLALTRYLRERFAEDKIYVLGESWGSALGVWLVQREPDLYHAFVSTGQMIDFVENDIEMYEFALQLADEQGRDELAASLRNNGLPPYPQAELIGKFQAMNGIINRYMDAHAPGEGTGRNLMLDSLGAVEYGLLDKVYWALSLINTFPQVYAQLYDVDLRTQAAELDVPMYFIRGRWDVNSSNRLTEEYVALLDAPHIELIWFEASAHTPLWDSPERFVSIMVDTVLDQTYPPKVADR